MHRRRLFALVVAVQAAMAISAPPAHAGVVVTKSHVPAVGTVENPCAGEDVLLSGDLEAVFVTSIEDSGDILVRYSFQAAGVKGIGATTGLPYLLVGEGHGTSSGHQLQRAVTASDYAMIAPAVPGIHRARATASVSFAVQLSGEISDVSLDSVFIDKIDC